MGFLDVQMRLSTVNYVERRTFIEVESDDAYDDFAPIIRRPRSLSESAVDRMVAKNLLSDSGDCSAAGHEDTGSTCSDITDGSVSRDETVSSQPNSSPRLSLVHAIDSESEESELQDCQFAQKSSEQNSGQWHPACVAGSSFSSVMHVPCVMGVAMPMTDCNAMITPVLNYFPQSCCDVPPPGIWVANASHAPQSTPASAAAAPVDVGQTQNPTSVILRNLPEGSLRSTVLPILDKEGFASLYDFVHVPVDFSTKVSMRYALINLVDHATAERFFQHFKGFKQWTPNSSEECIVVWNTLQGLDAHIERYRNSPLMHPNVPPQYQPALYTNGTQTTFPPATIRIKAPRMRHQKPAAHTEGMEH